MPRLHRRHQTGFTLVEVMIAIMIMAIISLISWQGLDSASRADEQLRQRSSHLSRQIRALQQLQQDIALRATVELPRTVISQSEAGGSGPAETTATPPAAQVANSPLKPLLPPALQVRRSQQLPFHLEVFRAAAAQPGQWQRVQWWVSDGTLYRAAGPSSSVWPLKSAQADSRVAVLEQVVEFDMRAWEPGKGWVQLPSPVSTEEASGVEITLKQNTANGSPESIRYVLSLE